MIRYFYHKIEIVLLWYAVSSGYAFLRLERSLLRWRRTAVRRRFVCLDFMNVGYLQLSSGNSAPNWGNNHHLTIQFEGSMHSFKRQGACVKGQALVGRLWQKSKCSRSDRYVPTSFCYITVRYVTKTWSVVPLDKKIHILLSQVYCVWQVVKTQTVIFNNPVFVEFNIKSYSKILIFCMDSSQLTKPGEWFPPLFFDTWKFWRQFSVLINIYLILTVAFCNQERWHCQL